MTIAARYAYAFLAWTFLILLVLQVFIAGLGMFADPENFRVHVDVGWMLHLAPILIVVAAVLSRAGRMHWIWALGLAVTVFLVPLFAVFRADVPVVAALHPVSALLAFGLSAMVARNSLIALRSRVTAATA